MPKNNPLPLGFWLASLAVIVFCFCMMLVASSDPVEDRSDARNEVFEACGPQAVKKFEALYAEAPSGSQVARAHEWAAACIGQEFGR